MNGRRLLNCEALRTDRVRDSEEDDGADRPALSKRRHAEPKRKRNKKRTEDRREGFVERLRPGGSCGGVCTEDLKGYKGIERSWRRRAVDKETGWKPILQCAYEHRVLSQAGFKQVESRDPLKCYQGLSVAQCLE
jgi:hypothetical protein